MNRFCFFFCFCVIFAIAFCAETGYAQPPSIGQTQKDLRPFFDEDKLDKAPEVTVIYHLRHVRADAVKATLAEFFGKKETVRVVAQERINAVIVAANKADQEKVGQLLETLDSPPAERLEVIGANGANGLKQKAPDKDILNVIGKMHHVEIAFDDSTGALIVRGAESDVARVKEVIKRIDAMKQSPTRTEGVYWLRVVWLRSPELAAEESAVAPMKLDALPKLKAPLEKIGIGPLTVGSFAAVRCRLNADRPAKFSASGTGATKLGAVSLRFNGELTPGAKTLNGEVLASVAIEGGEPSEVKVHAELTPGRTLWLDLRFVR